MIIKTELFVNQRRFRQYAVKYRKHFWNRWNYVRTKRGELALFNLRDVNDVVKNISAE